jgi:2-C-methyl-D-erythritol 4-phosphate cytidylyltransferase
MNKFVVIVAGGSGTRMNAAVPKQFLLLKSKPVLYYTMDAFLKAYDDINMIIVLPEVHFSTGKEIIDKYFDHAGIQIVTGGQTRFHSVYNGLKLVEENSVVFVHDAVRCIVSRNLIHRCYEAAVEFGTAVPVIASRDSLRIITKGSNEAIDRDRIKLVQTPQTFKSNILIPAFNVDYHEKFTDEASVVEAAGTKIHLVEGEENNIKITHPSDLDLAEIIMNKSKS